MYRKLLLYTIVLICLPACFFDQTNKLLDLSEQLMAQHPDSALIILSSVRAKDLAFESQRARHALLFSMALDKNYIDVTNDSTISIAHKYYSRCGTARYRMLSEYYMGVIQQNKGNLSQAAINFDKTLSLANKLGDCHNSGLACEHLSSIHSQSFNHVLALQYAEQAANFFDNCGETISADYARVSIANQLSREQQYDKALDIVENILANSNYFPLIKSANWIKAECLYYGIKDYPGALKCFEQIPIVKHRSDSVTYFGLKALMCESAGQRQNADYYLSLVKDLPVTALDSLTLMDKEVNIFKLRGDYKNAFDCLRQASLIQNKQITELLGQSVTRAMEEYYRQSYVTEKEQSRLVKIISSLVILLSLIAIAFLIFAIRKSKQARIQDMADFEALNEDLKRLQKTNAQFKKISTAILQDRIQLMQNLSESYFSWTDEELRKRKKEKGIESREELISLFKQQLGALRSDPALLESIEQVVNMSNDNIMSQLRSICDKKMKESDYVLLALLFSGLSSKSISFLLRQSEASIRTRKSRYRQYFRTLEEPYASRFLHCLG